MARLPERPNLVEQFGEPLIDLRAACESAVGANQNATTMYGWMTPDYVEMSLVVGGVRADAHTADVLEQLTDRTGDPASPERFADENNTLMLEHALAFLDEFVDREAFLDPDQASRPRGSIIHVVGRIAASSYDNRVTGHTEVYEVYSGVVGSEPDLVITGLHRTNGVGTNESVLLFSEGDTLAAAYYDRVGFRASHTTDRISEMFGSESAAIELLKGQFASEAELDAAIVAIADDTILSGVYSTDEIREVLADLRREALVQQARSPARLTHSGIRRLTEFASSLRTFEN